MFNRYRSGGAPAAEQVELTFEGRSLSATRGDSVAAALLAHGEMSCRTTTVSGAQRGPYCLMGVCFECLVMIDGRPNQQACMVHVQPGMKVMRQCGARRIGTTSSEGNDGC